MHGVILSWKLRPEAALIIGYADRARLTATSAFWLSAAFSVWLSWD